MRRTLPFLVTVCACQPMMAGPVPLPMVEDRVSTVELSAASPSARRLREEPPSALEDPPLPQVQIAAGSSFALTERVEAGPVFLLDLEAGGEPGVVTGGLFVRGWATEEDADLQVALRVETGWAWLGVGTDLVFPMTEEVFLTLSPTLQATPEMLGARIPLGVYVRLPPFDLGMEAGVSGGLGFAAGEGGAVLPWLGMRARLSL